MPFSTPAGWQRRLPELRPTLLVVMLGLLLLALIQPVAEGLARAAFVVHLGVFIVWQPFVEGRRRLSPRALLLLGIGVFAATAALDARLLMLWTLLLSGIVGGKVLLGGSAASRWRHLLALGFLVLALILLATPQAFPEAQLPAVVHTATLFGLPLVLFVMAALPRQSEPEHSAEVIDFINSVFVFLLLAVLVLGALAAMPVFQRNYAESLLYSLIVLGCVLLLLGWAWNPHGAFGGLGEFFSRYLMTIGLPVEQWLATLAERAAYEHDPELFVDHAIAELRSRLPWLVGAAWKTTDGQGQYGRLKANLGAFSHLDVRVQVATAYPLSPSMAWHFQLLTQLLGEFHADKRRARQLKELSYLQAVHETGARLTHDVKNLLQSLQALCRAAEDEGEEYSPAFRALLRRQLPAIATRLGQTLNKLSAPRDAAEGTDISAAAWWQQVRKQHDHAAWIEFIGEMTQEAPRIPGAVFSTALENLLSNAEAKRPRETDLQVIVRLEACAEGARLTVSDDGAAIPVDIAPRLLRSPVASAQGLGIGLFQAARLAAESAYRLRLLENRAGCVAFALEPGKA